MNGNTRSCEVEIEVVDTTKFEVTWDGRDIVPAGAPITFTFGDLGDACSDYTLIWEVRCEAVNGAGKIIDKSESCEYEIITNTITILDGGAWGPTSRSM